MKRLRGRAPWLLLLAVASCGRADAAPAADGAGAELRQIPAGSTGHIIAAAEAEGASFPRDSILPPGSDFVPHAADSATRRIERVGTAERRCVEVPTTFSGPLTLGTQVRSGEFTAGGYLRQLIHGRPIKLWWKPATSWAGMTLLVRGRLLGAPSDTLRYESDEVMAPLDSETLEPDLTAATFAPGVDFPSAGTWLLVTTSGRNWGCFLVTIRP